jgi:hypothetical protein
MAEREHIIRSLGELIDLMTPLEPDPETGRLRDAGVYRGASAADRPILTSLDRLGGTDPPHTKAHLEAHILRNFGRYARPHLDTPPVNDWELLVIAQHYGVPTRLLDWSSSPLVAAHFATREPRSDGACAIWRLDWRQLHRAFDLPELAFLIDDLADMPLLDGSQPLTPWKLFGGDIAPLSCMIEPPWIDERIVAQGAAFTLCTDTSQPFDAFLEEHGLGDALSRYIIPADSVAAIRDQLDLVGIDERHLFPNLTGVAASIRRYYG